MYLTKKHITKQAQRKSGSIGFIHGFYGFSLLFYGINTKQAREIKFCKLQKFMMYDIIYTKIQDNREKAMENGYVQAGKQLLVALFLLMEKAFDRGKTMGSD